MAVGSFSGSAKSYYSVNKEGKIQSKSQDGTKHFHDWIAGKLVEVVSKDSEYEGTPTFRLQLTFEDKGGELSSLEFGRYSNFGKDVILKLTKVKDTDALTGFNDIKITPFISEDEKNKKSYVRGSLKSNGTKIFVTKDDNLIKSMPAVERVMVGKKEVTDDSARNEYIDKLISELCLWINADSKVTSQVESEIEVDDDVPF